MIDAYSDQIRSPELLHLLIEGFDTDVLVARTTCGDTGFTNAIVLPEPVWPTVIDRLNQALQATGTTRWFERRQCKSYVARQCAPEFQRLYLERYPGLLDGLSQPSLPLEADTDNDLVVSLYHNGALPEEVRTEFVQSIIDYCIDGTDGAVIWNGDFRDMLTHDEEHTLRTRLMTEVVPNPTAILKNFTAWYDSDEDPERFTYPLEEFGEALVAEFKENEAVRAAAVTLENERWKWIMEQEWHGSDDDGRRYDAPRPTRPQAHGHRSVFDDLVEPT